jgi:HPt (histidine-containing phosphotransfer) domain-containing protein
METPTLDLSYLYEVSDNNDNYVAEVINLFLETVPSRLIELEQKVKETDDYHSIMHHAHFLKSSANIIKIKNMHGNLAKIEVLAKQQTGKAEMIDLISEINEVFNSALPLIKLEEERHKTKI